MLKSTLLIASSMLFGVAAFAQEPGPDPVPAPQPPPPAPIVQPVIVQDEDAPMAVEPAPAPAEAPIVTPVYIENDINVVEPTPRPIARRDLSGAAASVKLGVGTGDFTQANPRDITGVGPSWDVRGVFGAHSPIGLEAAYVGSARGIGGLGVDDTAALISNGAEADLRLAIPIRASETVDIRPFAFGGVGWQYLNLVGEGDRNNDEGDNIMTIPAGVGLELGVGAVNFDVRGTYRHAIDSEIFGDASAEFDDPDALHSFNVGAALGFEF